MIMLICMGLGVLFMGLTYWKDRQILRVELPIIQKFLTLMVLLTFFRFFMFSVMSKFGVNITDLNQGINQIEFWQFGLVFWEDAFFAIPIYWMIDKWKWSKYIWMPIVAALSIQFGLGHMYQFEMAYFATLIIPYFVFYRFGRIYGFGTTMICHILFDMITFFTFKLFPLVVL